MKFINRKNVYSFMSGLVAPVLWIFLVSGSATEELFSFLLFDPDSLFAFLGPYLSSTLLKPVVILSFVSLLVLFIFRGFTGPRYLTWDQAFDMALLFAFGNIVTWLIMGILTYAAFSFGPPLGI